MINNRYIITDILWTNQNEHEHPIGFDLHYKDGDMYVPYESSKYIESKQMVFKEHMPKCFRKIEPFFTS